jgi:hypothetical protein
LSSKIESFAVGDPWIFLLDRTSGATYAWLLGDKEPCNRCIASEKFFIVLASI